MSLTEAETREAETCYLGCLKDAARLHSLETSLKSSDFESRACGRIFEVMISQYNAGKTPDDLTLSVDPALADIKDNIPESIGIGNAAQASQYEAMILDASRRRQIKAIADLLARRADARSMPVADMLKDAMGNMDALLADTKAEKPILDGAEILRADYGEKRWIARGLIGEGLTMISGAPKVGKSWLALNLAIAAATGGMFLNKWKIEKPTETLYISLEDTPRSIQARMRQLDEGSPAGLNLPAGKLAVALEWGGRYAALDAYLDRNPRAGLVIIDTMALFAGPEIDNFNDYKQTYEPTRRLKAIADKHETAIVLIHHARKAGNQKNSTADWRSSALGSTGFTGAVDTTILVSRDEDKEGTKPTGKLYVTGREALDHTWPIKLAQGIGWTITDKPAQSLNKSSKMCDNDEPEGI